jgi:hypothetical protein
MCLSDIKTTNCGNYINNIDLSTKWCNSHLQKVKYKGKIWYLGYKSVVICYDSFSSLFNQHGSFDKTLQTIQNSAHTMTSYKKYLTGFHIFSNYYTAKDYANTYHDVIRVLFRFPRIVGLQNGGNCVVADEMIIFNPRHKKLQNILKRNGL